VLGGREHGGRRVSRRSNARSRQALRWHPVLDVDKHRFHLVHPHPRVHPVEGRRAPEQRMRSAEPLAGGVGSVEGLAGPGDDLGQEDEAVRRVGRERAGLAPPTEGAGETPRIRASRASDTWRCDWRRSRAVVGNPARTAATGSDPNSGSRERAEGMIDETFQTSPRRQGNWSGRWSRCRTVLIREIREVLQATDLPSSFPSRE
jgi:hypothetical protein